MRGAVAAWVIAAIACGCGGPEPPPDPANPTRANSASGVPVPAQESNEDPAAVTLPLSGAPRKNKHLQLEVYEAGFDPRAPAAPPGLRYFTAGLRGIGLTRAADVEIPIHPFVFAQNERGCISRRVQDAPWLTQPFGEVAVFTAKEATRGQLAFLVPDDSEHVRILVAPAGRGLVVAAGDEFTPAWPEPVRTIDDGSTLRVLILPSPTPRPVLPSSSPGFESVVIDFVLENLKDEQGIEFTTSQQLRLVDPDGKFVQPAPATKQLGCRLDDLDVVPPGHARRFQVVYEMPAGAPKRLQYRGFEVDEITVELP